MNRSPEQLHLHLHLHRLLITVLCLATVLTSACGTTAPSVQVAAASKQEPSRLESIDQSEVSRVILTDQAAKRLDIQTEPIRIEESNGAERLLVPYAALIYDLEGEAWVYTSPAPLTFVRANVDVETIEGDTAVLSSGPAAGTIVVTVGGAELYGAEFEFQEG